MLPRFADICCARISVGDLGDLAVLRTSDVRLFFDDREAWIRWQTADDEVTKCLLPIKGVAFYSRRGEHWYPFGSSLPAFDVPADTLFQPLHQVLFPAALRPVAPPGADAGRLAMRQPVCLALRQDHRPRPTTCLICAVSELLAWADKVPSFRLSKLRGAHSHGRIIVVGMRLPAVATGRRFWGKNILVPLGYCLEPQVPESTVFAALGLPKTDLLIVDECGEEVISREILQPVHRAGLRRVTEPAGRST